MPLHRAPKPFILPDVWQDDAGAHYWAFGHADPAAFILACIADTAHTCGFDDVLAFLRSRAATSRWIDKVEHLHVRIFDEGERFSIARRWDPRATRVTRMVL